ncbi:protein FAR-RED IMPAIRED RESPONSE 1-like [Olea europaea var. sylvestris]|uniref:protein FAR-RED IMPAIRED RESPONSE 1-like n=1 Tax=Olea europaea var. sylvestris TaxID=158386 RepID=UPI000C1D0D35|nr:protein FAR-RED IMPAIRED RESPONSE 1-like [Olea europaea var. sylvestris]
MEDASFVEFENDNVDDNVNIVEEETVGRDDFTELEVSMQFKDEKEVYDFYARYAYVVGFSIRKRSSTKDDDGVLRYITFTCSREGRRSNNTSKTMKPQPTIQTGCKAKIFTSFDIHGYWKINTVHLDHNHKTSPTKSRLYRCNRELSAHVKRKLEVNDMARIPLHKSFNFAVVEAGGYENMTCMENDCRNCIEQVRRLRLGEGDAVAIQSYFCKMQARCPRFYFSIDLDDDSHLKNFFGQTIDAVSNEDTDTFVWLFKTWLQCMHGQAPHEIITDQDRAMQNIIQILPEKFGYHVDKFSIFLAIYILVYDSQFVQEFEDGWKSMIDTYDLHNNDWFRDYMRIEVVGFHVS